MEIIKDSLGVYDKHATGLRGEVIFGRDLKIKEFVDPFGNKSYRSEFGEELFRGVNMVPLGAYQWVFSKMMNLAFDDPNRTNVRVGDLNSDYQMKIGVRPPQYEHQQYVMEAGLSVETDPIGGVNIPALESICGFMVGDGGAREDNITAIAPDYKRRMLYHPIPFYITDEPNDDKFNGKFYGRYRDQQGSTSFYIKRFETTGIYPHIVHAWVTGSEENFQPCDESVFSSTSSTPIESYIEFFLKIDKGEVQDHFMRTNTTPRINEIGLVTGWYNKNVGDYENIRMLTIFTRPTLVLTENDRVEIIYRLYAR